jgi:metal-responsive CopG/Arc/MetJ family transcriptional regulator
MLMKRGNGKKLGGKLLTVWVPKTLLPGLDQGVKKEDSNRSKFIRNAIREKLARQGITARARAGR